MPSHFEQSIASVNHMQPSFELVTFADYPVINKVSLLHVVLLVPPALALPLLTFTPEAVHADTLKLMRLHDRGAHLQRI